MKKTLAYMGLVALVTLSPVAALADCYAEYKAKRDTPFTLVYDVIKVDGACTKQAARAQLQAKLAAQGLTLLKVVSVTKR